MLFIVNNIYIPQNVNTYADKFKNEYFYYLYFNVYIILTIYYNRFLQICYETLSCATCVVFKL